MKNINELERLTPEQLEQIASDESVRVPADLKASLEALAGAAELAESGRPESAVCSATATPGADTKNFRKRQLRPFRNVFPWIAIPAAATLAAAFIIFRNVSRRPQDTFSDPYLAYAEIQKTFSRIAESGDQAARIAGGAVPVMEKTEELLNRIMK